MTTPQRGSGAPRRRGDGGGLIAWSIEYPSRAGWRTILVGGLLSLGSILIIPWFVLLGYLVHTAASAASGEPQPPASFGDWMDMLVDGIVLFLLAIVAFVLLLALSIPWLVLGSVTDSVVPVVGVLLVWLGGWYVAPAAFVNFAVERRASAAFDVGQIRTLVWNRTYLVGWLGFVIVINGIGTLVVMAVILLSFLTIVGWIIIIPMVYFYWYAIDAALWGRVYYAIDPP